MDNTDRTDEWQDTAAHADPLLLAHQWIEARRFRQPMLGDATMRVLRQLCHSAARHCFTGRCTFESLPSLLDRAGLVADTVERAFPEWTAGAVWMRDAYDCAHVHTAWQRYRQTRGIQSRLLNRVLLETMICSDLRHAGLLRSLSWAASGPACNGTRDGSPMTGGAALAGAVLLGWLWTQTADPAIPAHPAELPAISAMVGATGWACWLPFSAARRRAQKLSPVVEALRNNFAGEVTDLSGLAECMRRAVRLGVVWSTGTLQVFIRMRMDELPRPGGSMSSTAMLRHCA